MSRCAVSMFLVDMLASTGEVPEAYKIRKPGGMCLFAFLRNSR